jgi:hypothetical protein
MKGGPAVTRIISTLGLLALVGCGGGGGSNGSSSPPPVDNTLPVQVNYGPANNLVNGLFATVTICVPGTSSCQSISGVQVDTGSIGLRLVASQVSLALPRIPTANGTPLGNCVSFVDNSYSWGPVATADVEMAGEKAPAVPIQLIGASDLPAAPPECSNGGTSANTVTALGANGLLGIGVFRQDCGSACSGSPAEAPKIYFACSGLSCSVTSVSLAQQLQNPVWLFPQDNNGVLISLPTVTAAGAPTVSGSLIFGIGTQADNALGAARVYTTDDIGNFTTTFANQIFSSSYLDTGSNGFFFQDAATIALPSCVGDNSDFSCPPQTVSFVATTTGHNGTAAQVAFNVANADLLLATNNAAFNNLAGPDTGDFDWGLPFFFGRNTFVGIEGQAAGGAVGPFWAY